MKLYENVLGTIGGTPLVRLRIFDGRTRAYAKLESRNPGGSVKDRIALKMIEDAEKNGDLEKGRTIVEPTSGNTGIGLAVVSAVKGYKLVLTMPENMSRERQALLKALGAGIVLTPEEEGMGGAVKKAEAIAKETGAYMPQQFKNKSNPEAHEQTTAQEIWTDTEGQVTHLVAGIGTGGAITGIGRFLKRKKQEVKIYGVEPAASPVLNGGTPGTHAIQGIGAGFVPEVFEMETVDRILTVGDDEALEYAKKLMKQEGILAGISSGAALAGAAKIVRELNEENMLVVVLPDTAERYLSTTLFKQG